MKYCCREVNWKKDSKTVSLYNQSLTTHQTCFLQNLIYISKQNVDWESLIELIYTILIIVDVLLWFSYLVPWGKLNYFQYEIAQKYEAHL